MTNPEFAEEYIANGLNLICYYI